MALRRKLDTVLRKFEKTYATHNLISVSRSALLHNIGVFERLSGQQVIPVLKGNAYGHGVQLVAKALKDRKLAYIAVDGYFEALRIREVSKQPVLIMGAVAPENFAKLRYDHFAFVVQDEATIHALGETGKHIKVHLECNTGMNRYGATSGELTTLTKLILRYKNLKLEGVMSHLADADGDDPAAVSQAVAVFDACVEAVHAAGANPSLIHIAQSAGSLKAHSKYANTVRLGIGTYGINPFPAGHPLHRQLQNELRPALQLTSTITHIIDLQKGDKVSYNYTFTAPKAMKIGVLPLGYYEGVNRAFSNTGIVKIGDQFTPIVGRVCMNHTMISLEGIEAQVGDQVVVYSSDPSDQNSIDQLAAQHNLFNYNLLTALSPDVRRALVD
ncbi:MAG TPA: alanine racemase [Candidatus Saccharimonadales bacterium]|nr:alanine racemase [Candidatus Saccharimonadales bacterium]